MSIWYKGLFFTLRYREQVKEGTTTNYGRARQHYTKANHLEMRNGRPFNMLAILAKLNNRKFEAVYFHVRCLASRNAFTSSKVRQLQLIRELPCSDLQLRRCHCRRGWSASSRR